MTEQAEHSATVAQLPTLNVVFNPEAQTVSLEFKPEEFRTWDMVLACLNIATRDAEFKRQLTIQANLQQQAAQQMQAMQMANQLRGGGSQVKPRNGRG